jgi:hypothetical protein
MSSQITSLYGPLLQWVTPQTGRSAQVEADLSRPPVLHGSVFGVLPAAIGGRAAEWTVLKWRATADNDEHYVYAVAL